MKFSYILATVTAASLAMPAVAQQHSGHQRPVKTPQLTASHAHHHAHEHMEIDEFLNMVVSEEPTKAPVTPVQPHDHSDMSMPTNAPAQNQMPPSPPPAVPQHNPSSMDMDMSGMNHSHMDMGQSAPSSPSTLPTPGSGTSRLPANDGAMHGLHIMSGDWMLMAHGAVSAQYTKTTGPRGDSKTYATSMAMLMAQRDTSWGRVQFKSMFSLEPLMRAEGYPNLFASGETANGVPLVDRQHPHDLFMELSARVDVNIADNTRLFVYGGPVGEPALGPSAFMHRASAQYNPEPPITHHWFDSTHITYGVATIGIASRKFQLESSIFTGR
ncbi:MAG: hypothetical protein RLY97_1366, partial [Pseudomonadota bacterium]